MTRDQAYEILNPIQNKLAANGTPLDIVTFTAFMNEGAELQEYVESKQATYA